MFISVLLFMKSEYCNNHLHLTLKTWHVWVWCFTHMLCPSSCVCAWDVCVSEVLTRLTLAGPERCRRGMWVIAVGCAERHLPSVVGCVTARPHGKVTCKHTLTQLSTECSQSEPTDANESLTNGHQSVFQRLDLILSENCAVLVLVCSYFDFFKIFVSYLWFRFVMCLCQLCLKYYYLGAFYFLILFKFLVLVYLFSIFHTLWQLKVLYLERKYKSQNKSKEKLFKSFTERNYLAIHRALHRK